MDYIEAVFLKFLNMSITAGYITVAVLLIRLFIRRLPKIFSYALWSAVAFRLLCPVSFSSFISIFNISLFNMTNALKNGNGMLTFIPSDIGYMETPKVTVGIQAANSIISEKLPAATQNASVNPMQVIISVAALIWLAGVIFLVLYALISFLKVRRRVKAAVLYEDHINCRYPVYECDTIPTAFILGFIKPIIYIPFRLEDREREYILCHEQCHIRRLDHIIRPFSFLLLALYWFNPLLWIAYLCMCRDMEMSCDEKALSDLGPSVVKDYSRTLLSVASSHSVPIVHPTVLPPAFGEDNVKRRIKNILNFKQPGTWIIIAAAILCIGAFAVCAANPTSDKNEISKPYNITELYGRYEFDETIFINPLSSFMPAAEFMPYFEITDTSLKIVDQKDGRIQEIPGSFDVKPLDKEAFKSLFDFDFLTPDLSVYDECYEYASFSGEGMPKPKYSLYIMDKEVWLVDLAGKGRIWSIYRLVKTPKP